MIQDIFNFLALIEDDLWGFVGFPTVLILGSILTWKSAGMQIRKFPAIVSEFFGYFITSKENPSCSSQGLGPMRAFCASIGGCLGIGNVVGVATAVQIGGPGSLLWIWITAVLGSIVKFSEVYIGIKHRRTNPDGSHRGGPMFFLQDAFGKKMPALLFCALLCLYGVEIYQFNIVASVSADAFGCDKIWTVLVLLVLVLIAAQGGLKRVSSVASILVPLFISLYLIMCCWVLINCAPFLPQLFSDIVTSAFSVRAAEGGFVGSSLLLALSQGVRRGCYSSDIGIGYASIIHSETTSTSASKQARMLIFEVFADIFIVCSLSALVVLITGEWKSGMDSSKLVQKALSAYFPHMEYFMPFLLSLIGYSTVLTYFSAGCKTAMYLCPRRGKMYFFIYAIVAFCFFSFQETEQARCIMSYIGLFLLLLNSVGIWKLRKELVFDEDFVPVLQSL